MLQIMLPYRYYLKVSGVGRLSKIGKYNFLMLNLVLNVHNLVYKIDTKNSNLNNHLFE